MFTELRQRYQQAVAEHDIRTQVETLEALAREAIVRKETLAAPRLVEESLALLHSRKSPFSLLERVRVSARLCRVWIQSGQQAQTGKDPSKYWFFHT
ncbi:MAG TPA: hypothetical protein EYN06_00490 [Myxococcales bacterium]|nr:hypothetical protein [Myxococcales bacterium]HIN84926.1 hypothetical protein [Myxococcales bacterium]